MNPTAPPQTEQDMLVGSGAMTAVLGCRRQTEFTTNRNVPGGPMVANLPSKAGDAKPDPWLEPTSHRN